ncbi:MAG: recombinase family protein, partial [Waterburya sp.]
MKKSQSTASSLWITGTSRTGKTSRLVTEFTSWVRQQLFKPKIKALPQNLASAILVFAANNQNRRALSDRLVLAVDGTYPVVCKTPVGFITDEVMLFFPLIFEELNLKAQFPLRLRPETEQELATQLWRNQPDWQDLCELDNEYRLVRQTLDLMQLAGSSGVPTEDISTILHQGLSGLDVNNDQGHLWQRMGELLLLWRSWCLDRGLLTYGLIYELYWRYLLPNPQYQQHLKSRYQAIFADDVDDYPAIARDLFEVMLDQGVSAVFTYNSHGKIRLGLNADPDYLEGLAARCQVEKLTTVTDNLAIAFADTAVDLVNEAAYLVTAPDTIQSLQTISRAELLRQTAEIIIQAVQQQEIEPTEIAIIAPGLDEIARYSLIEILSARGIPVTPLNEQRPIISSPLVRSLLTLLSLVYADLGRLVDRDAIAEMLTVFSHSQDTQSPSISRIDPV